MKINPNEVYWNEDRTEYAVLVSPGWGAGWSSWNYSENNRIAWDKRIVEFVLRMKGRGEEALERACDSYDPEWDEEEGLFEENKEFLRILDECGIDSKRVYFGGVHDIEVKWVKPGDRWRIDEEDGAELLEVLDMDRWMKLEPEN